LWINVIHENERKDIFNHYKAIAFPLQPRQPLQRISPFYCLSYLPREKRLKQRYAPLLLVIILAVMHSAWVSLLSCLGSYAQGLCQEKNKQADLRRQQSASAAAATPGYKTIYMFDDVEATPAVFLSAHGLSVYLAQLMQILKVSQLGGFTPSTRHATTALSTSASLLRRLIPCLAP